MISKSFLAKLSCNLSISKQGGESYHEGISFGGINVILCGDLHQFPPVAQRHHERLYHPNDPAHDPLETQIGCTLYEEFDTVVILKEQICVTDTRWRQLLNNLRQGQVQQEDLQTLRELIINTSQKDNLNEEPWASACLVTPRHAVRMIWNEYSSRKWCQHAGEQLLICTAEDTIGNKTLTQTEKYCLAMQTTSRRGSKIQLPNQIKLAKGMKVLVTNNIVTDLDITNGARGEIIDIILHPDEPTLHSGSIVHLRHLPICILVKLTRTRASILNNLDEHVVPIEPLSTTIQIDLLTMETGKARRSVV